MKIRKTYSLFINHMLGTATYGGEKFRKRMVNATLGQLYICTFTELKHNLRKLEKEGYTINKRLF